MRRTAWALWVLVAATLAACAQSRPVAPTPSAPPPVGQVALVEAVTEPASVQQLDIGVRVFDNRSSNQFAADGAVSVFTRIREIESHYLPVLLRNTLVESGHWGAVRVLPEADPSMDLMVNGTILASDGTELLLEISVRDSSGREWLSQRYLDQASSDDYPEFIPSARDAAITMQRLDAFQDLYARIANDILAVRDSLNEADLTNLTQVTSLRYASDLSPDAFAGYLQTDGDGLLVPVRLPASNDPMLARVADIRARHDVFIDTIDEYYAGLYRDIKPTYHIWRQYSHDQVVEEQESLARENSGVLGSSGSFESLARNYNRYKWAKIYEQEFVALAQGFVSETEPALLALTRNISGLTGPVEEQYAQWRQLLRELFELETGLSANPVREP